MAKADITIEIHDLRNEPSKFFTDAKLSAGVTRIIHEKNELQLKYELARHECYQKEEHIRNMKKKQEELLKENSVLRERLELLENENRTLHEIINQIRVIADCRSS